MCSAVQSSHMVAGNIRNSKEDDKAGVLSPKKPWVNMHTGHASTWHAGYLSAICHDLDHKGVNNDFLIKTSNPLAIQYNDLSPLENHHVSQTFRLLQRDDCGLLRHLSKDKLVGCCPGHVACIWLCGLPTYWCSAAADSLLNALILPAPSQSALYSYVMKSCSQRRTVLLKQVCIAVCT